MSSKPEMKTKQRILVIEDEPDISTLLVRFLEPYGFSVAVADSGEKAWARLEQEVPDLILLDLMLPDTTGFDLCRELRAIPAFKETPIIMLTALSDEADIVLGLELGASDYITKPFSKKILLARIKSALRKSRPSAGSSKVLKIQGIELHTSNYKVMIQGKPLKLPLTEFKILHQLILKSGQVLSREQIINLIKGPNYPVTERSVDVQIMNLRKHLGEKGKYIETVWGVGYRFKEDASS